MTVLTFGTFDTPHMGHAAFLRRCEAFGRVVVAVRSDWMVKQLRGHWPVFRFDERAALIEALGYQVVRSEEPGKALIEKMFADVLAVGSDWARKEVLARYGVDHDFLDDHGITLAYIPYTPGISTTEIKRRLG